MRVITFNTYEEATAALMPYIIHNQKEVEKIKKTLLGRIELARIEKQQKPWGGLMRTEDMILTMQELQTLAKDAGLEHELKCPANLYAFEENSKNYYACAYSIIYLQGEVLSQQHPEVTRLAKHIKKIPKTISSLYSGASVTPIPYTINKIETITDKERKAMNRLLNDMFCLPEGHNAEKIDIGNLLMRGLNKQEILTLEETLNAER